MAEEEISVDKQTFHDRLSSFIIQWKADNKRSGDAIFGGVNSIAICAGSNPHKDEAPPNQKTVALHV